MSLAGSKIFINIPVENLADSIAFYTSIGFTQNPKYSDDRTMMMVLSPYIHVMLLTPSRFRDFMPPDRDISDARKVTEALFCLSATSKEGVDDLVVKAEKAGGKADVERKQDLGDSMYGRSFEDLDGHVWEVIWMSEETPETAEVINEQAKEG